MIPILAIILLTVFIVSLISLIGIFSLLLKENMMERILFILVSFAAGSLLGAAFLDLLPEAIGEDLNLEIFNYVLLGIILFFIMEKFLYWYHCHKGKCNVHTFTYLNLIGDGIHNFIDGIIIATSFLVSIPLGTVTSLAIILHEIPQEMGDFGILVYGGLSKRRALFYNFISALTAFLGALIAYFFLSRTDNFAPFIIAFAAGGFIYIACSDLIPELHKERDVKKSSLQFILLLTGIAVIFFVKSIFG